MTLPIKGPIEEEKNGYLLIFINDVYKNGSHLNDVYTSTPFKEFLLIFYQKKKSPY